MKAMTDPEAMEGLIQKFKAVVIEEGTKRNLPLRIRSLSVQSGSIIISFKVSEVDNSHSFEPQNYPTTSDT